MYLSRISLHEPIAQTQLSELLQDRGGYGLHRLFWDLVSDGQGKSQQRSFLFREEIASEQLRHPGKYKAAPVYYLLSNNKPALCNPIFQVEPKVYQPVIEAGERFAFKLRVNAVVKRDGKRHDVVMDEQVSWLREQLQILGLGVSGRKRQLRNRLLETATETQRSEWRRVIEESLFAQKLEQTLSLGELLDWAIKTVVHQRIQRWWMERSERLGFEVPCNQRNEPLLEAAAYRKHALPEKSPSAGFNSIDLSGEVVVRDVELFKTSLYEGIGPSKAFGCGLMMIRRV